MSERNESMSMQFESKPTAGFQSSTRTSGGLVGTRSGLRLGLVAALSLSAGLGCSFAHAQEINDQGWTVLEPSEDTRFVFVSESDGHDSNSGFAPSDAVKTFERAKELLRGGSADWMLLKRGDVWNEGIGTLNKGGRSAEERLVISSYGDAPERPKIVISIGNGFAGGVNGDVSHVALVGIHFQGDRPDQQTARGVRWLATGENMLIEDCYFEGFKDNITCEPLRGEFENFAIRRSVIVDAWSTDGHSQGVYLSKATGIVVEENLFDHNGWSDDVAGASASLFNQNVYIQKGVTGVEFIGNITARASGAGVQMRSGGIAMNNLCYANPLGLRFGYHTLDWPTEQARGVVEGNVVLGGPMATNEGTGNGTGMWIERVADTVVKENVVAHYYSGTVSWAYALNGRADNVTFLGNVAYDWVNDEGSGLALKSSVRNGKEVNFVGNQWHMPGTERLLSVVESGGMGFSGNEFFGFGANEDVYHVDGSIINYDEWNDQSYVGQDELAPVEFPDSRGRDLDLYAQHLGYSDAVEFLYAARGMNRTNWDPKLTGTAATQWIREGYIVQD